MEAINQESLVEEAWRQIAEATMTGKITLSNGEEVEVGSRKAAELLRVAENMVKRAPKKQRKTFTLTDFTAQDTSSK